MGFKDIKEKFLRLLFTEDEVEDASYVIKTEPVKEEKAEPKVESALSSEKPAEVKIEVNSEVKPETVFINPPKPKTKKKKAEPVIVKEDYEQRDIISPIYGNMNKPMPKGKTSTKPSATKASKVLSPIYGVQNAKVEEKPKEVKTEVKEPKKEVFKETAKSEKVVVSEDKIIEKEIKKKIEKIETLIGETDDAMATKEFDAVAAVKKPATKRKPRTKKAENGEAKTTKKTKTGKTTKKTEEIKAEPIKVNEMETKEIKGLAKEVQKLEETKEVKE